MREDILNRLRQMAEPDYKKFNCSLIPGIDQEKSLGVRIPKLRKLSREILRGDWENYLTELENCKKDPSGTSGTELFYEEILLQAILIGAAKMETEERLIRIGRFVPRIDNWAVCDTFCSGLKFAAREENRARLWDFLQEYLEDKREYSIRFGVVMLLDYFIDDEHIDRVLTILSEVRHEGYYVKMAVAWALSVCYVDFPEKTEVLLNNGCLDTFTHNKTIQKIRESFRVSKADKERLKLLKRK